MSMENGNQQAGARGTSDMTALIRSYDERRKALLQQANELARMRDEVRGAADREAAAVLTKARQRIRDIVADARRELMVLSAQVDAMLGQPDPLIGQAAEGGRAHEHSMAGMFEDAAGDLDGFLAESDELLLQVTSGGSQANGEAPGGHDGPLRFPREHGRNDEPLRIIQRADSGNPQERAN